MAKVLILKLGTPMLFHFITKFINVFYYFFLIQNAEAGIDSSLMNDWKFRFMGNIETVMIVDSTRSFREISANAPVARPGTFAGSHGRAQLSLRSTRFGLTIFPPHQETLKQYSIIAIDFLGYNPNPSSVAPQNSEAAFYASPTPRLLLASHVIELEHWKLSAGLGGRLFGWVPTFYPTTVSIFSYSGVILSRTTQLSAINTVTLEEDDYLKTGLSITSPSQRDAGVPNIDAGIMYVFGKRESAHNNITSQIVMAKTTLALSGTYRQFSIPDSVLSSESSRRLHGRAIALSTLVPLVARSESKAENTLILSAEFSKGIGYSDVFVAGSGNISQLPSGAAGSLSSVTNLDPGLGGFDSSGKFNLSKMQSWNTQLQYHLPVYLRSFITVGFGHWQLKNPESFSSATGLVIYDISKAFYTNIFHDIKPRIRIGFEYARISTDYTDGVSARNNRYQFSTMFMF